MDIHYDEGQIQTTSCREFKQYVQSTKCYPLSKVSMQVLTSYMNQHHITDTDFNSIRDDITKYSNYILGKEGFNENSSLIFQQCQYNKSLMLNLSIHIECFSYHKSQEFHTVFLIFTANTFSKLCIEERQSLFQYIIDQVNCT